MGGGRHNLATGWYGIFCMQGYIARFLGLVLLYVCVKCSHVFALRRLDGRLKAKSRYRACPECPYAEYATGFKDKVFQDKTQKLKDSAFLNLAMLTNWTNQFSNDFFQFTVLYLINGSYVNYSWEPPHQMCNWTINQRKHCDVRKERDTKLGALFTSSQKI